MIREPVFGSPIDRIDADRMLSGRGEFVADVMRPDMLHAVFVRSPLAHATVGTIDIQSAAALPGVVAVLTADDFPATALSSGARREGLQETPQPILARDRVRFVGEAVAIVVAENRYVAEDASRLVVADYEALPVSIDPMARSRDDHEPLWPHLDDDVVFREDAVFGDPSAAFASAAHVASATLDMSHVSAAPIETRGCVAEYDPATTTLTFWSSTQAPHRLRNSLSGLTGLAEHRINVKMHDVGGAFGSKIPLSPEEVVVALTSLRLHRPVKWIEDRRESLVAAPHARGTSADVQLALGPRGELLGAKARFVGDAGAYSYNSGSALVEAFIAARRFPACYRLEHYSYTVEVILTNKSPIAPFRGVGDVCATTIRELGLDAAAREVGVDRVAIRRRNLVTSEELPYTSCTGFVLDSGSFLEAFDKLVDIVGYDRCVADHGEESKVGRTLGVGLSVFIEASGDGAERGRHLWGRPTTVMETARVALNASGTATVSFGTTSQGQGIETAMCQIAADVLGLSIDDVDVVLSDTATSPVSTGGTRASRVAVVTGGAVGRAAEAVREQILRAASHLYEVAVGDLEVIGRELMVVGAPSTATPMKVVIADAFRSPLVREREPDLTFSATRAYDMGSTFGNGAIGCVVEVDTDTGRIIPKRVVVVDDCGTVINPASVDGQVRGGVVQGIGSALYERVHYDENGQIMTATLFDYLLPVAADVPDIDVYHVSSPSPNTWRGIKGAGEGGSIGTPAAVLAAVADALAPLGVDIANMPLLPELVSSLVEAKLTDT